LNFYLVQNVLISFIISECVLSAVLRIGFVEFANYLFSSALLIFQAPLPYAKVGIAIFVSILFM
jgi:hypothetical protein